ncbi:MAG: hypothetical protein F4Z77_07135 [Dehalococcoidia bacterium]|nr:hypothetical protein [Dehalococcoidia bacterium]
MKAIRELMSPSPLSMLAVPALVGAALLAPINSNRTAGLLGATPACAQDSDLCAEMLSTWGSVCEAALEAASSASTDAEHARAGALTRACAAHAISYAEVCLQ